MKKHIMAAAFSVVFAAAAFSGCGTKADSSAEKSSSADSSDVSQIQSEPTPEQEREDGIKSGKYDPVQVNDEVESSVEAGKTEPASPSGYYSFTWSDFGDVYSNEELEDCFDRLQKICSESYFDLAFSYKNINTGAYVGYNQYTDFMTCSTIKAPYVKSILQNGIDLSEIITRNYIWPGDDGTVALAPYGTTYTAKQLIEYTILESDNTAYYLLFNNYGYSTYNSNQYQLGSSVLLGDSWIFTYCTSDEMMYNFEDIYHFGEENETGAWLIDLLSDTDVNMQIGQALGGKYKVAQKYGSEFNEIVFNDCAIVYADSPFVLSIFTNQMPETEESCKVFKDLAVVFDDINTLLAE